MRKFASSILNLFAFGGLLTLILVLNVKFVLLDRENLESLLDKSGVYNLVTSVVKDHVVNSGEMSIDEGPALEILNDTINPDIIKIVAEDGINQFFAILEKPDKDKKLLIDITPIKRQLETRYNEGYEGEPINLDQAFDKPIEIDLSDIPALSMIKQLTSYLLYLSGSILLLLLLSFSLGKTTSEKFSYVSGPFLSAGIFAAIFTVLMYLPNYYLKVATDSVQISDPKIYTGVEKIVLALNGAFRQYFLFEAIILLITAIFLIVIARANRKADPGMKLDHKMIDGGGIMAIESPKEK